MAAGSVVAAQVLEEKQKQKKPVTRAQRPTFEKKDWEGIFFDDIFRDGLVGQRSTTNDKTAAASPARTMPDESADKSVSKWSEIVDAKVLENEVKRWQQNVTSQVTTAGKFKTTHQQIRESFQVLSMLFGIIAEYDGDVRWKDSAVSARHAFIDAASKCRTTDMASFNNVKQRSQDLTDLVRGSKYPDEPRAKPTIEDWSTVADRNAIMNRLETSVSETLKEPTSNEKAFKDNVSKVSHEAGMIAAMGQILTLPEMLDAEEDDYKALAQSMLAAAREMKEAADVGNLEQVNAALNRVNQACVDCHAGWQ